MPLEARAKMWGAAIRPNAVLASRIWYFAVCSPLIPVVFVVSTSGVVGSRRIPGEQDALIFSIFDIIEFTGPDINYCAAQ